MSPVPPKRIVFPSRAFTVAEARANGVTERRLRARDLTAPFHGLRLRAGWEDGLPPAMVFEGKCLAVGARLTAPESSGIKPPCHPAMSIRVRSDDA